MPLISAVATKNCAAVLIALALSGCAVMTSGELDEAQRELNENRRQWEAQAISDYRFVARRICFCPQEVVAPVVVQVRGGQIDSLTYQETNDPVAVTYSGLWPTLDGVFDMIQEAIDRNAHEITVEYDPDRGYPTSINIDYIEQAIDEELAFTTESFEPLP